MKTDKKSEARRNMRSVGMTALLLGLFTHWFVHPTALLTQGLIDGVFGCFSGISIACNLLSLRQARRNCSGDQPAASQ